MYELNRVLLQSIGPKGARYENVLLDFRDEAADPARGSLLYLENGGGKSVLLKLLFSVVLAGRKNVVGATANTKTLENFVLSGDTGHVVLEWRRVTAEGTALSELLLTGKAYEWRGRQHSSDSQNLREGWWTLRPTASGVSLDDLPTRHEGRKRTFASFKEQLEEANRANPELELVWTDVQRKWHAHLDALGLDPELFKYQREMNADEGDADELFAFRSHDAFVDFLLRAVTDREGPTELASNVDLYTEKLRDRERLQLEQTFVEGALERLKPLAEATAGRDEALRALHDTHRRAEDTHGQFAAAAQTAAAEQQRLETRAEHDETRARSLDTRGRELQEQLRELRRRAAQFRLDDAEQALKVADEEHAAAHLELDAWRASEDLTAHRAAAAEAPRLAEALADAERDAAPLLERRAAAASRYAGALMALIDEAQGLAGDADEDATTHGQQAQADEAAAGAARETAGRLRAEARAAEQQLENIETERSRLVAALVLARGQTVEEALAAFDEAEHDAERREGEASDRIAAIDARVSELGETDTAAALEAERAADAAQRIEAERDALRRRGDTLADNARLKDVAGLDHLDVWRMADGLRQAVSDAVAGAERAAVLLELDAADDQHAFRTLEETGRLPAARDAEDVVEALRGASVPAVTGWEYLAESVRADQREAVLRRMPELIGGVVVSNPAHRERAEAVLAQGTLRPTSIVVLGDSAELDAAALSSEPGRFVVEPNAALYEEDAAEAERQLRGQRLAQVAERRRELSARYRSDQQLRHDLDRLLADCPAGHLDALDDAADVQRQLAADAKTTRRDGEHERATLAAERPQRVLAAKDAQTKLRVIERSRSQLEGFHERAADEPQLGEVVRSRTAQAGEADGAARRHTQAALERRHAKAEATRLADDERRRADRLSEQLSTVEGAGDAIGRDASPRPLDELRGDYELATRLLTEATTGSQLAADHQRAEHDEAKTRAALEEHPAKVRERASELLVHATDRTARREGELRAHRAATLADDRRADARSQREHCQREVERETPRDESGRGPRAQLTGELIPHDLDHALSLQTRLDGERAKTVEDQRAALEAARQARARAAKAESRAEVLAMSAEAVVRALGSARGTFEPDDEAFGNPYPGSTEEAKQLLREISDALSAAERAISHAEERVRHHAERLVRYAGDEAFAPMAGNLRERLSLSETEVLAREAEGLLPHLQARLQEVARELASIEKHRSVLVQRFAALVQAGLAALRQAGRASRLPAKLGDWSGKQFLRIDFESPDSEEVLLERLGEVLDSTVSDGGNRDGMTMLLRGVRAAAHPRGFRVTVLKPDTVLRDDRVDVTAMGEFSGGQRLTAAIALYCTLAAMRSASRGRRQPRAGVLFLDNPIGTASAEYLLDIQLKVAERVGVQLVYTTGVFDTNALSKFPCVLRLRNDLDMRAGMQHIHVADSLRHALVNGHALDDGAGYLDVARVVQHRNDEPSPA